MTPGQYRTRYLKKLLNLIAEQGIDPAEFAQEIGFSIDQVNKRKETSREDYENVHFSIIDRVDIPGLGFEIGQRIEPLDLSLPGLSLLFSSHLEIAIKRWVRYQELTDPPLQFQFFKQSDIAILRTSVYLKTFEEKVQRLMFATEESFAEWAQVGKQFDVPDQWFTEVHLSYPRPKHGDLYQDFFGCKIKFDQPCSQFIFPAKYLELPSALGDKDIVQLLDFKCSSFLKVSRAHDELIYDIRTILMKDPEKYTRISEVSKVLHISERTLRRRLTELGTTFKEIVFNYRMSLATEYLSSTKLPISAISMMIGYSDTTNFFRAFRQYISMTPNEYRIANKQIKKTK